MLGARLHLSVQRLQYCNVLDVLAAVKQEEVATILAVGACLSEMLVRSAPFA